MGTGAELPTDHASATHSDSPAPVPLLSISFSLLSIFAILLVVCLIAIALLWPWLPLYTSQAAMLNSYQPFFHGQAMARVTVDTHGVAQSWTSENVVAIPAWAIFSNDFPPTIAAYLQELLPELNEQGTFPPETTFFRSRSRLRDQEGNVTSSDTYFLRQPQGDAIIAVVLPGVAAPLLYNPPIRVSLADISGATTTQSGNLAGLYSYTLTTTQSLSPEFATPLGNWQDCRQLDSLLALENATTVVAQEHTLSTYCFGAGLVEQVSFASDGQIAGTTYAMPGLTSTGEATLTSYLPPFQPIPSSEQHTTHMVDGPIEAWTLTQVAHIASAHVASANAIAPTYVAGATPYLLAAVRNGPLLALDPQSTGHVLWEFQTAGSIYSQPAVNPDSGYLYFGSSDKHLYALTGDGLFLWRAPTHDNIAAQPLIQHGSVYAVAEDGTLYALNAQNGVERWEVTLGSATIATPIYLSSAQGDHILVGEDDGWLTALNVEDGGVAWQIQVDGAIRAPLRIAGGRVFVVTTASKLYALTSTGEQLWSAETLAPLRTAPTLGDGSLFVVDSQGWLYAFDPVNGRQLWRSQKAAYLGAPLVIATQNAHDNEGGEILIVSSPDGQLSAFTMQGELLKQWYTQEVDAEGSRRSTSVSIAPTFGGGAIWLGDDTAVIHRLGPPAAPEPGN